MQNIEWPVTTFANRFFLLREQIWEKRCAVQLSNYRIARCKSETRKRRNRRVWFTRTQSFHVLWRTFKLFPNFPAFRQKKKKRKKHTKLLSSPTEIPQQLKKRKKERKKEEEKWNNSEEREIEPRKRTLEAQRPSLAYLIVINEKKSGEK